VKVVSIGATPNLSVTGSTVICSGNTTTLTASGATTYTWSTSANTTSIAVSPATTTVYTITGAIGAQCQSMKQVTVTVNALPSVSISPNNTVVCQGEQLTLNGAGAQTYTWSSGVANGVPFTPVSTAVYTVTGTDANGCKGIANITIPVNPLPAVGVSSSGTIICSGETAIITATGASTYTWNTGENSSAISVTPVATTDYTVSGTDGNGCTKTFVYEQTVDACTSIRVNGASAASIAIYPNPNNGWFMISAANVSANVKAEVYNELGQQVFSSDLKEGSNEVNLTPYANGIYFVRIVHNGKLIRGEKVVKQ
jgi:hypothetical protein